ncbi:MAG: class I SAM-dependent methyltransferase [Alphaproteobacteria bacterium]|nr:class I SAM-dependent methyltransferase [Alphaproteobacteria bacterium]
MGWPEIQASYKELATARNGGAPFSRTWAQYRDAVLATRQKPPYHLEMPLRILDRLSAQRPAADIRILDYGCGGASTLLYMLALGYRGIHGVDIDGGHEGWNRLLLEEFGIAEQRFFTYDGINLPFESGLFDLVTSEEVVEHVPPSAIDAYYANGARVLKPDGIAYFTVPHRLVPYDSHTRTWLIHYLPHSLSRALLRVVTPASQQSFLDHHLFLRWPWFHRRQLAAHYAESRDLTRERLLNLVRFDYYDGPRGLRQVLGNLARLPVAGTLAARLIEPFLLRQTVSSKEAGRLQTMFVS